MGKLNSPEVSVELTGEPEAGRHAGHGQGDQVVQVTVGRGGQLQGPREKLNCKNVCV